MTTPNAGGATRRRLSSPRIAETVADELRRQIIDGELADGDLLPPQAALVEMFNVSLVSLREALRILETEGLVSVRRGNQGGAIVHAPAKSNAAYMLGLLLQSEDVELNDLAVALKELEPTCAALGAQRSDRGKGLIPDLQRINDAMAERLDDGAAFTDLGRKFHNALVRGCGNHTMVAVVGSLEALWSGHEQQWAEKSAATGEYPSIGERQAVLKTHQALTDAIELGDVERAREVAARHLADTQTYVLAGETRQRIVARSPQILSRTQNWARP